jgi:hypothetical protein
LKAVPLGTLLAVAAGLILTAGCASIVDPQYASHPKQMYPGQKLSPDQVAVVQSSDNVFVTAGCNSQPQRVGLCEYLPGKQTLTFGYFKSVANGYLHSTKPYPLEVNLTAGHRYQVVGYESDFGFIGSFMPTVEDVTTQSNVWSYYEKNLPEEHQLRAVQMLTDEKKLQQVAKSNPKPVVRRLAIERIKDIEFLRLMLNEEIDDVVRRAIQNSIRRMELTAEREQDAGRKR